nr:uncharacterized protein LOC127329348 [Lolium perenne]
MQLVKLQHQPARRESRDPAAKLRPLPREAAAPSGRPASPCGCPRMAAVGPRHQQQRIASLQLQPLPRDASRSPRVPPAAAPPGAARTSAGFARSGLHLAATSAAPLRLPRPPPAGLRRAQHHSGCAPHGQHRLLHAAPWPASPMPILGRLAASISGSGCTRPSSSDMPRPSRLAPMPASSG